MAAEEVACPPVSPHLPKHSVWGCSLQWGGPGCKQEPGTREPPLQVHDQRHWSQQVLFGLFHTETPPLTHNAKTRVADVLTESSVWGISGFSQVLMEP